jgi:hypothetical protein
MLTTWLFSYGFLLMTFDVLIIDTCKSRHARTDGETSEERETVKGIVDPEA